MPYNAGVANLGEAYVEVRADTSKVAGDIQKGVTDEIKKAEVAAEDFKKSWGGVDFKKATSGLKDFSAKAALPATLALGALTGAAGLFAKQAEEAEIAQRRLGQILKSMGFEDATERVSAYADTLEKQVAVDGEVIKATQAKLATFKNLTATVNQAGGAFDRATVAALDLAAAGFGSAETNAVQLGKALQDPIKGISALARAGVTFTAQEKENIKVLVESGKTLEAQNLILQAIETQVGGTAEATKSDFASMKIAIENTGESIGTILLPIVGVLATVLEGVASFAEQNSEAFVALGVVLGTVAGAIVTVNVAMKAYESIAILTKAVNAVLGSSFSSLQVSLGVIGVALAAATAVYALLSRNKQTTTEKTNALVDALKLEKAAQSGALTELLKSNEQSKIAIASLKTQGLALNDVSEYAKTGGGSFKKYVDALQVFDSTTGTTIDKLDAFSKALGITIGLSTEAGGEAAYGLLEMARAAAVLRSDVEATNRATELLAGVGLQATGSGAGNASKKIDEMKEKVRQLKSEIRDEFAPALERAKEVLKSATDEFDAFGKSVADAITGGVSAGDAYKAGTDTGKGFISALTDQVNRVRTFSELLNRLLTMGLSESALQQVLAAGTEAGTAIATDLIKGGQDAITGPNGINALVASAEAAASAVGLNAASRFRQAGVDAGTALVSGIESVLSTYRVKLSSKKLTPKQLKKLREDFSVAIEFEFGKVPEMANGGIVTSRQQAIIGEAGAEAVIPISRPARAMDLLEQSGLASLVRSSDASRAAVVSIGSATFVSPTDVDILAQKVLIAEKARSFG